MSALQTLVNIFSDHDYAWQLLECEIAIQMTECVSGSHISKLLQLYMRGVERMNSILDPRQSYFKGKVTELMGRSNVIRSLNKSPMAKKSKHLEIDINSQQPAVQFQPVPTSGNGKVAKSIGLQEKKKEIQLRMAYQADEHNPDYLKKMLCQQNEKEIKIVASISSIMKTHQDKLNERIQRRRKQKTSTFRSQTNEAADFQNSANQISRNSDLFNQRDCNVGREPPQEKRETKADRKLAKSVETKAICRLECETPPRTRKLTFDEALPKIGGGIGQLSKMDSSESKQIVGSLQRDIKFGGNESGDIRVHKGKPEGIEKRRIKGAGEGEFKGNGNSNGMLEKTIIEDELKTTKPQAQQSKQGAEPKESQQSDIDKGEFDEKQS